MTAPAATSTAGCVRAALASAFAVSPDAIGDDTSLRDDLGADSLALVDALAELEEELGVELPDSDELFAGLRTAGAVVRAFEAALAAQGTGAGLGDRSAASARDR